MLYRVLLCLLVVVCLHTAAFCDPNAQSVNILDPDAWTPIQNASANIAIAPLSASELPKGARYGMRIVVRNPTPLAYWAEEVSQPLLPAVAKGARYNLRFWARSATGSPLHVALIDSHPPYTPALAQAFTLTGAWKEHFVEGELPGYAAGASALQFQYGDQAGVIDLAGVSLQVTPLSSAFVADERAISPDEIQARIRRYRMADLTITVCDEHGHLLPGVSIHVAQTRHAFLFGCNSMLLQPDNPAPWQLAYQQRLAALFNFSPVGFFWNGFEPSPGHPNYAFADSQVDWLLAHDIACEGTPLIWQESYPAWAPADVDSTITLLHRRVTDLVRRYKGKIDTWIVVNEANSAGRFDNGEGNWVKRDGKDKVIATAQQWTKEAADNSPLTIIYNDYDITDENISLLNSLQSAGALPDAIGIQAHMHQGVWPLVTLWQTCRRFSQFGRPLYFTESTILSGPTRTAREINYLGPPAADWNTTPQGEAFQAEYVARFYSLLFSDPAVRAINWWDLSDREAWLGAPAGLLRADMSPKPAYTSLLRLIRKTWWTDALGETDLHGRYIVRAFYGSYQITASDSRGHSVAQCIDWPEGSGPRSVTLYLRLKPAQ